MAEIVEASELFNADELIINEPLIMNLAPMRPLYGPHREYPRFIVLLPALGKKVKLTLGALA